MCFAKSRRTGRPKSRVRYFDFCATFGRGRDGDRFVITCVPIVSGKDVVREWYSSSKLFKPRKNPKMYSANINSGNRLIVLERWQKEREIENYFIFSFFLAVTGPFTQLVWSNTKELGVGKACSRSGRIFVVANYYPRGNVNGQYANNVHMNQYFLPANKKKLETVTRYWVPARDGYMRRIVRKKLVYRMVPKFVLRKSYHECSQWGKMCEVIIF